jgi:exodeoxyribonuclease VII large subunit
MLLQKWKQAFDGVKREFVYRVSDYIDGNKRRYKDIVKRISAYNLQEYSARLNVLKARFRGYDPKSILRRGYAICTRADGTVIASCDDIKEKEHVDVELGEGHLECRVEHIRRPS